MNTQHTYSARVRLSTKIHDEYKDFRTLPGVLAAQQAPVGPARPPGQSSRKAITAGRTCINFT
jgi:pleiotropic regulator 1